MCRRHTSFFNSICRLSRCSRGPPEILQVLKLEQGREVQHAELAAPGWMGSRDLTAPGGDISPEDVAQVRSDARVICLSPNSSNHLNDGMHARWRSLPIMPFIYCILRIPMTVSNQNM